MCRPMLIEDNLHRRRLIVRQNRNKDDTENLKKIIERNASLRVSFGWSFESRNHYTTIMDECIEELDPFQTRYIGTMASDDRCDWLGFLPFTVFDKSVFEHLDSYGMISFNNKLIEFQIAVIKFISQHKIFRQHALLRDSDYRFDYYKAIRNDTDQLADAFCYYIDSIKETVGITTIPRQYIEEQIGHHYLRHPEVFFELLEFYKLKGNIYE